MSKDFQASSKNWLAVHLRVIEEPERRGVRAQEIPDGLVVYLHG
jgi:hypothetical protein